MEKSFSNGSTVSLRDWADIQVDLALQWPLTQDMEINERIHCWSHFFAGVVSDLCGEHGVPVDALSSDFAKFVEIIIPHVDRLKWLLSEAKGDIGLEATAEQVGFCIQEIGNGDVELDMVFPPVNGKGAPATESVVFHSSLSA